MTSLNKSVFGSFNREDTKRTSWRLANWNDTYWSSNSIWHNKSRSFVTKLKTIRFSEQSMQWFRSYLCDRIFLIKTENKLSDFGKISSGVPWGSFLGLALFLDLCQWYASSSKIKFALVCLSTNKMQRNKYKTTSTSNISWMCIRWVNFWWTYGTMALKF